jgi:hypothetical protein
LLVMLTIVVALSIRKLPVGVSITNTVPTATPISNRLVVKRGESIAAALKNATAGSEVVVEPGEYREAVSLASDIRLVSLLPGGATLRLPATAQEADAAVVASGIAGGALIGFRIVGDAATALGTGLLVRDSTLTIADVEITGATNVAVDIAGASQVTIMASDVHDNPGAALAVRSGSSARITHNVFIRNGVSPQTPAAIQIEEQADLRFTANTFYDVPPAAFRAMDESARAAVARDNWFLTSRSRPAPPRTAAPARGRGRPGGLPADR